MTQAIVTTGGTFTEVAAGREIVASHGLLAIDGLSSPSSLTVELQVKLNDVWWTHSTFTDDAVTSFDFKFPAAVRLACTEHDAMADIQYAISGMHQPLTG